MATSDDIQNRVKAWVPRFADSSWAARLTAFTSAAIRAHDEASFLITGYTDAMASWVLHHLTLLEREDGTAFGANVSGPVTSIRTGEESISFQQSSLAGGGGPSDVFFNETTWGRKYLSYRDTRPNAHLFII